MNDYEAKKTFQQIVAQIVERLASEDASSEE